jgi:hypothetical protein
MARTTNPGHLIKNMSMEVFGAFVVDLVKYVEPGLHEDKCKANKIWLRQMAAAATILPDANIWGTKIFQRCDAIVEKYDDWNDDEGTPQTRDKNLQGIKRRINKLAGTYRRRIAILEKEADIGVYYSLYQATEKLILAFPSILFAVAEALAKYPSPPLNSNTLKID